MNWRTVGMIVAAVVTMVAFSVMGSYANATLSGVVIGVILATGVALFIWGSPTAAQVTTLSRRIAYVVLFLVLPSFLLGMWSPAVKTSLDRWSNNHKQVLANKLDKSSLKSESESGIFCRVTERSALYDEDGKPVWSVPAGTKVKAVGLEGSRPSTADEGMVKIMLSNKYGDFKGGNIAYISSRKINWDGA